MKVDLYRRITADIITAIEAGVGSCQMPWHQSAGIGTPANAVTSRSYRGINTLLLWAEASRRGFSSGRWATYRQWGQLGAQVRKGERSTTILLWKPVDQRAADDQQDGDGARQRLLARAFHVFNADQVEGYAEPELPILPPTAKIARADAFFDAQAAERWEGGDSAFYDPRADIVSIPSFSAFKTADAYYSVLAHELTHWTGAKTRLDRDLSGRFGSAAYAMEELVAELGAAFTVGHLGLGCEPRYDHAPYIASWLRVLADDPRAILTAASKAQAAADYMIAASEEASATDAANLEIAA